jgi:lipoprotein-anchoring transpeptidase ErfK/SrfK
VLIWILIALTALAAFALAVRPVRQAAPGNPAEEPEPDVAAAQDTSMHTIFVPAATDPHPLPDILVDPSVVVEKSSRRLTVHSEGVAVKGYRIALGREPVGDKEREGDGRTPEGEFYLCSRNPKSKYHRSVGLSYPNEEDADRGLKDGLITKRDHRAITTAVHRMERPPWKTALGGEIMIHGSGATHGDWTLGCIALDDRDIDELFTALPLGTPVVIVP